MPTRRQITVTAAAASMASAAGVLPRMRREFDDPGTLSSPTVAWMYGTYIAHAATTAAALSESPLPVRPTTARVAAGSGTALVALGVTLFGLGASRFAGPGHISAMNDQQLALGGAYRWSRNPQYVGYVTFLAGLSLARRSSTAAVLSAGAAAVFAWWVPVEEQHLATVYGTPYRNYLDRVPRWLPGPRAALSRPA